MAHNLTTRVPSSNSREQPVIDVDEVYLKYEYDSEEDGIQSIDANTFRQSVRRSEGREKDKDKMRRLDSLPASSSGSHIPHASNIRENFPTASRLQEDVVLLQQKRSASNTPQPAMSMQKRRKLNSPTHTSRYQPIAGPSRLPHANLSTFTTSPIPRPKSMASTAAATVHRPSPSLKRRIEVIELSSDDGEVAKLLTPRKKKIKSGSPVPAPPPIEIISSDDDMPDAFQFHDQPEPEPEPTSFDNDDTDDDDDGTGWDWDTIGDIQDSERWIITKKIVAAEDDINLDVSGLSIKEQPPSDSPLVPYIRRPDTSKFRAFPPRGPVDKIEFIWDKLRACQNLYYRKRFKHPFSRPFYTRPWNLDFHMHSLKCEHSFKKAPGCISKIEQSGEWTAIGSASIGGLPDDVPIDPGSAAQNRPGSLMTWRNGSGLDTPSGHVKKAPDPATGAPHFKYYAVHDVKFDPHGVAFASTGADRKLRIWTLEDEDEADEQTPAPDSTLESQGKTRWKNSDTKAFSRTPYDIVFNPESSMLAVAEKKVNICKITEDGQECHSFRLYHRQKPHIIGSMAWGIGPTTDLLFVSSEPDPSATVAAPIFDGIHAMYSPEKERILVEFDAKEAGDTLAVNTSGDMLALSTRGGENRHILRLYDVTRQRPKATAAVQLSYFPKRHDNFEGEVCCASFSPDGLYLAMGRNDNHVHVYDVRMLHRGPIFDYEHFGESKVTSPGNSYGVLKVHWMHSVQTTRMALLSGGEDGCIRMWDPTQASGKREDNGTAVATMNSDIMSFSYGDRYAGEHVLVVGDADGEVKIFNDMI